VVAGSVVAVVDGWVVGVVGVVGGWVVGVVGGTVVGGSALRGSVVAVVVDAEELVDADVDELVSSLEVVAWSAAPGPASSNP
jgi:hypothetical protein